MTGEEFAKIIEGIFIMLKALDAEFILVARVGTGENKEELSTAYHGDVKDCFRVLKEEYLRMEGESIDE